MTTKLQKYLSSYQTAPATEKDHYLVYVPYKDHSKVSKYLKKNNIKNSIRFTFDYSLAIFYI